jgi:Tol biopolymer transport system component
MRPSFSLIPLAAVLLPSCGGRSALYSDDTELIDRGDGSGGAGALSGTGANGGNASGGNGLGATGGMLVGECQNSGWQATPGGCVDVDECASPTACGMNMQCTNFEGGYKCDCLPGFIDEGAVCVPPVSTTERVSVGTFDVESASGGYLGGMSDNGQFVAFSANAIFDSNDGGNGAFQVFVRNRSAFSTERVSENNGVPGNASSGDADISGNGKIVAFVSTATNLVGGDTNGEDDVFAFDLDTRKIERVNVSSDESQAGAVSGGPSLSNDGRYVAFWSYGGNLAGSVSNGSVYVRDRWLGTTIHACVSSNGLAANSSCMGPVMSGNGRYVAFFSGASNLGGAGWGTNIYVRDLVTLVTEPVSVPFEDAMPDSYSVYPAISDDGRYVAFASYASNLVPNDTNGEPDVFVYDRIDETTQRVSVGSGGIQAQGGESYSASISGDGRYVGFYSCAQNLVADDDNAVCDVFVRDTLLGETERVSLGHEGQQGTDSSYESVISADGRVVAFNSYAPNMIVNDTNGLLDVFARVRW